MNLNNNKDIKKIRVRFAPSPTGSLHIGSARTAIVNYLFAKANNGTFILRIEDTDVLRSTKDSIDEIINILRWLGIDWDEGPYFQSERLEIYKSFIQKLLESNEAYRCFCSQEELEEMRKNCEKRGEIPRYNGKCRNLNPKEIKNLLDQGKPYTVRLKMPQRDISFDDLIKGKIVFRGELLDDIIIARSDGTPTYNFSVSIDDALMNITHVIRGEDHVSNTPKQIAIYNALGLEIPQFAHIPLILGPDKTKLSKRHCDTAIEDYRDKGYLPDAIFNYLALLGYSHDPQNEVISKDDLIKNFDLSKISKSPSQFDINKLTWINSQYIKKLDIETLIELSKKYIDNLDITEEKLKKIISLSTPQIKILSDIREAIAIFTNYEVLKNNPEVLKLLNKNEIMEFLKKFWCNIKNLENFNKENLEALYNSIRDEFNIKNRDAIQIIRYASTGKNVSPPLFDTLELLGKDESIKRIKLFIEEFENIKKD